MVFSSSLFLLYFLPAFLLLYHIADRKLKNYVILIASIYFYAWGAPKFVFLLMGSTIVDFYLVQTMHRSKVPSKRKMLLALSVSLNVGLLLYFKYANFFIENVNSVLEGMGASGVEWTKVALPIGISFYTFQTLTYSVDIYRNIHKPLDKLSDYLLYIMSFPQMIAGPIVRFNSIADQITDREEKVDDKLMGFIRFGIGLGKKVLIANAMGAQADAIMDLDPTTVPSATLWLGILAYTFQIYFDFSGYSDMAIGLGRIMGFTFPENFDSPYVSGSITEFWRRWHITLGTWMRDYLYIPLGGNRVKSKRRLYFNLWFVFLVSGLWHGASWNFVIWGAYHGLFLILDRLFLMRFYKAIGRIPSTLITFLLVVIGWVFFRVEEFDQATTFIGRMFLFSGQGEAVFANPGFYTLFAIGAVFAFLVMVPPGKRLEAAVFRRETYSLKGYFVGVFTAILLLILSLASITASGFNPFIYFRF